MNDKKKSFFLFFLGCFSLTQINIIGYLGISELFAYILSPYLLLKHKNIFTSFGFNRYICLTLLWMGCSLFACLYNGNDFASTLKGTASAYSFFSITICGFLLLYDKPIRLKWYVIGSVASVILSTFILQKGADIYESDKHGLSATEAVVSYKLYWMTLFNHFLLLAPQIAFLKIPLVVSLFLTLTGAGIAIFSGGRSTFSGLIFAFFILLFGKKIKIGRPMINKTILFPLIIILLVSGVIAKKGYTYLAVHGYLGREEQSKYELQTKTGTSPLHLLMAGRSEFFVGFFAALDAPFIGRGYQPLDKKGYRLDYVEKYGDQEDKKRLLRAMKERDLKIPAHSHIIQCWLEYGLGGLVFWCYVLWIIFILFKNNLFVVPEWFGYFALTIPATLWGIFFSPMGYRVNTAIFIVCCLIANSVGDRLWKLKLSGLGM